MCVHEVVIPITYNIVVLPYLWTSRYIPLCRDIYFAKYYGRGGEYLAGEKNENEELGEKNKKGKKKGGKLHEKRGKGP